MEGPVCESVKLSAAVPELSVSVALVSIVDADDCVGLRWRWRSSSFRMSPSLAALFEASSSVDSIICASVHRSPPGIKTVHVISFGLVASIVSVGGAGACVGGAGGC